jgi:hypothetical protein
LSYQDNNQTYNFDNEFWNSFEQYLNNIYRKSSVKSRFLYAKQYHRVVLEGNAQTLLVLSDQKRLQVMKSLSVLSKFMGCYDKWKDIKERYQLKWSNDDSLQVFKNLSNRENNYSSMLKWLKDTCLKLPSHYSNILVYCTLTGLRPDEACQSSRLVKETIQNYLDRDKMILKHFEFPDIFIRRTKQTYVSIANDLILNVANDCGNYSYNAIRCYLKRKKIPMNMNYCRKIFATFMRNNGIEQEIIDLLQGRIPKAVFVRHYYRPDLERFDKIRELIDKLYNQIIC